ncbi:hypothetical protein MMC08_006057 [Hypocenomyce scalaris]|nr:hypothetical protein [Hypocenomyce scalaris]
MGHEANNGQDRENRSMAGEIEQSSAYISHFKQRAQGPAGASVTVNLKDRVTEGTAILLVCNVVWGDDDWDGNNSFVIDSSSNTEAPGHKFRGARYGGSSWDGNKPHVSSLLSVNGVTSTPKSTDITHEAKELRDLRPQADAKLKSLITVVTVLVRDSL